MDAKELLREWPGFAQASAAHILSSPAWRLETRYDGKPAVVTRSHAAIRRERGSDFQVASQGECDFQVASQEISLSVSFDDVARVVTFAPSPLFPDLWELREHLKDLPSEVLLALVERACGPLFQLFEDMSRQSFSIAGLSEKAATGYSFTLATEGGEIDYRVDLSPTLEQLLGQLSNLDVTHDSIRALTREVVATYGAIEVSDEDAAALAPGDCLVLPEDAAPAWTFGIPGDGRLRIVATETRVATFAEIADGALGPVPPGDRVELYRSGRKIASGAFSKLGEATVVKVVDRELRGES